ncbi:MAG: hypothetical protein LWW78_06350 [Deltaproteobacteria bacterium]|nr:hypothetical protein [Deltaproteobacteria bacterium]MDL1972847.1 hypothetical protein [Deltaproteobacteria bacterium]
MKVIPFSKRKNDKDRAWVEVFFTPLEYEAYIIYGLLKSRGVPCHIQRLKHLPHPVDLGQLGGFHILVPSIWEKIAKGIIENAG